jgi:hypothetical protein
MKHHKLITRRPEVGMSNFQAWKEFLERFVQQVIEAIFQMTS